jgi:hypothetical protein
LQTVAEGRETFLKHERNLATVIERELRRFGNFGVISFINPLPPVSVPVADDDAGAAEAIRAAAKFLARLIMLSILAAIIVTATYIVTTDLRGRDEKSQDLAIGQILSRMEAEILALSRRKFSKQISCNCTKSCEEVTPCCDCCDRIEDALDNIARCRPR